MHALDPAFSPIHMQSTILETNGANIALKPADRVCTQVGSLQHPFDRYGHVYVLPRLAGRPPSRSNTPLLCRQSSAIVVAVFDLRLLGLCQSSAELPSVIEVGSLGVFDYSEEFEHSSLTIICSIASTAVICSSSVRL
jgi:hypothetical protein